MMLSIAYSGDTFIEAYQYAHFFKKLVAERDDLVLSNKKFNFSEIASKDMIDPIIWTSDKVLLGYLIQWLKDNNFIAKSTSRDKAILNHFVDEYGKPIGNIRQGLQNMRDLNNGSLPQKYEKIEALLKDLKDFDK